MKELLNNVILLFVAVGAIFIVSDMTEKHQSDTTIKKYIDEEANMMCYYTDTWGSCFYVLKD